MKTPTWSLFFILLLSVNVFFCPYVRAVEDEEDEDAVVNEDNGPNSSENVQTAAETEADEETAESSDKSSPFVKTKTFFIQPKSADLPAGRLVKLLIGFHNNGTSNFILDSIDGAFRYPQDFSYFIQNFSTYALNKVIEPEREATIDYLFTPSETFASRQFGLVINLRYRDVEGKNYVNAVFNETVSIVEPDEGLDGETFFLYIFLAAIVVLLVFGAYQFLTVFKKKGRNTKSVFTSSAPKLPNGSSVSSDGIDYEWIPKEHLQTNKSPKVSPRQRKPRNGAASLSAAGNSSNDEQ